MDVAAAAVGSVMRKLLQLLGDEYNLQRDVKEEVESLSDELWQIHAFLCHESEVVWNQLDLQLKAWVSDIREISYDMENILDTFLVRVEGREPNGDPSRLKRAMKKMANLFSFSKGKARNDVGCAIRDIKTRFQEAADQRDRYLAVNSAATTSNTDPRLQAMYKEVASLVGVDEPSKDLISKLSARADDMARSKKTVAIVGMGGLGKTALAKAVYDKIRADFECGAFVLVGRDPNLAKLLRDILYELDKNKFWYPDTQESGERQLIDNLRKFLGNKRYFIVIDDIWESKSWKERIELALLDNNCGSRIIITTRNTQVAKEIGGEIYRMQSLSDDNSKKLFYTRIFGAKEQWPDNEPDEISKKILKKCDGVPLAIITMASLLVGKPREKWSDVFTSVGFGHKGDKEVDNTMKILSFSYYDLPVYLRTCLLYLSVYPEDYMIDKESLIWKWIAEGFIQGKPGIWLFELGEQCFNDLVNRSMIQAVEWVDSTVKGCRVHDMVLDLIRSISSEVNFVTILDNDEGTVSPPPWTTPRTVRRLALHGNTMEHTAHGNMKDMAQVRSLFISFRCAFGNWVKLPSFKLLHVLDLEGSKTVRPSHLVHLENLSDLRYLGLNKTYIGDLPNEIGALKLLQTLNLISTRIRQLTPSISRLTQLVCLKGDFACTLAPNWIGKLTSLEELQVAIRPFRGSLKALGSLRELRVLRCNVCITDESMQRDLMLSLCNLHKLRHLDLLWLNPWVHPDTTVWGEVGFVLSFHLRILRLHDMNFSCLPRCIGAACLPNLTSLSLHVDAMDKKGLEFLGRLPELCYLCLFTKSTLRISKINASNSYFQKLRLFQMPESMIQFRCKEEDSSISFHVWNGIDAMPFGSSKNDCSKEPYAVMPNLEMLDCSVFVRASKYDKFDYGNIGLEYLPSLRQVIVYLKCKGASAAEMGEAEAALRKATEVHPNRPMLTVHRLG